jgi:peptidyl-prolyl cis-trans isomerase C
VKHAAVVLIFLCSMMLASCTRQQRQIQDVAKVDDQTLTLETIYRQLDTTNGISEMQVRMFARQWVNSELLFQEAKRLGLDNTDAVRKNLDDARRQLTINALLEKEIFNDTPQSVSKEEVAIYFRSHEEEFVLRNDIVYISLAVFSSREPAAAFREAALQGAGWDAALASFQDPKNSSASFITKTDSMFYTQATLFPSKLWKVASALGTNEVSFPVRTSAGYFVLLSLGNYSHGAVPPVEFVDSAIRGRLVMQKRQQRFAEYVDALRKKHTVEINLSGTSTDSLSRTGE